MGNTTTGPAETAVTKAFQNDEFYPAFN
jgi:hypothetical protein